MAESTTKPASNLSQENILRASANFEDGSLTTTGFLTGKVGRRVEMATVGADTEVYTFLEDGIQLYEITIVYTDGTKETMLSSERTA